MSTRRITFTVMLVMSVVVAIAGRLEPGGYLWGTGFEFSVIAAVILGGISLIGGMGTAIGRQQTNRGLIIMVPIALAPKK